MDEAEKKTVLRSFTYGLYVVTCRHAGQDNAFTANWLTQVSFEPPLLALSVENDSVSLPLIRASGMFAVCVLSSEQRETAGTWGRSLRRAPAKLEGFPWQPAIGAAAEDDGPLALADSLGWVTCAVESETPAGDSTLLVARVVDAHVQRSGEPLTMRAAGFRHSG